MNVPHAAAKDTESGHFLVDVYPGRFSGHDYFNDIQFRVRVKVKVRIRNSIIKFFVSK